MKKVKVNLENCYGIKKLTDEFDFSKKKSFVIYAPNGVMKTSFAKTFEDLSKSSESEDRIHKDRKTVREINDENDAELNPDQIFVIQPYNQDYKSEKISRLLANAGLKKKYDEIVQTINEKEKILIEELKKKSGLKNDLEETFSSAITHDRKKFRASIIRLESEVAEETQTGLETLKYSTIFDQKVLDVIKTDDFRERLKEYIEVYDRLIASSVFFKKGIFNHNNAADIAKNLKANGYFKANHSVKIKTKNGSRTIESEAKLEEFIEEEKESILKTPALKKSFEEIDNKLKKNKDIRAFRDYLENNKIILPELENLDRFKQRLWIAYLTDSINSFQELVKIYKETEKDIEQIISQAKNEVTRWQKVIEIFNERFSVPFVVKIENQDEVILEREVPNIKFEFQEDDLDITGVPVEEPVLVKILSNGEKRALYILNIIFEIEARKTEDQETLFIIDDIADSFDYKNKYAIIEYLKEISEKGNFYQILLSHNFDFYRTICGRFDLSRENKLHVIKSAEGLVLKKEKYQNNPFDNWKDNFDNDENLIASIPFLRNLSEYCGHKDCCEKLTSLLHIKQDTDEITVSDLQEVIKTVLKDKSSLTLENPGRKVKPLIFETADKIYSNNEQEIELESKVVLSIAIRLKTEEFLIPKIDNDDFISQIKSNQTYKLIEKYKENFKEETSNIELIDQVNLMTPENIHLNSFMYEPILDMSNIHLKNLYEKISGLIER